MLQNINVSITGAGTQERELMSNVITKALVEQGYSNVALVNTVGEPMIGSDVQSLADVLRRNHPDFLERAVRVWSIPVQDIEDVKENEQAVAINDDDGIVVHLPGDLVLTPQHQGYSAEDFA